MIVGPYTYVFTSRSTQSSVEDRCPLWGVWGKTIPLKRASAMRQEETLVISG
jgi:hypothetical protein